jgi:hypothetical protein
MALYHNDKSHPVYIGGRMIPAGQSRDVPDHLLPPITLEPEAIEGESDPGDGGGHLTPGANVNPAADADKKPTAKQK